MFDNKVHMKTSQLHKISYVIHMYHAGSKYEMHTKHWSGYFNKRILKMEELEWRLRVKWVL